MAKPDNCGPRLAFRTSRPQFRPAASGSPDQTANVAMLSAAPPPPLHSIHVSPPQSPVQTSLPPFPHRSCYRPSQRSHRGLLCSCSSSPTFQGVERSPAPTRPPALERGTEFREEPSFEPFPAIRTAKRVVLVRHGQSTWNAEGRIQGSSDISVLTPKGEAQAETSRQMLLGDSFDVCFTSPLARSKKTAEIIWGSRKDEMIPDSDLREIDLYSFQGLLKHEGKQKFGQAYRQWQIDPANFCIDGHYPVRELWARARNCWNKILAHEGSSVLVVAHNAVNQALVATSLGLSTKYFRVLLQSNCGVSVLDFTPRTGDSSPYISLNRLNQTPNSPLVGGSTAGRKTNKRMILVSHGMTQRNNEGGFRGFGHEPLNMLGVVQSQKTAELLLDVKVDSIICSPRVASLDTATAISEIQEAADCLGADYVPRNVEMKKLLDLEIENVLQGKANRLDGLLLNRVDWLSDLKEGSISDFWVLSEKVWRSLLLELPNGIEAEKNVLVVAHPAVHIALIGHCLRLKKENMGSFHLDHGSVSVLDFPDGASGRGIVRCVNYTAHLGRWSIPVTRSTANDEEF